MPVPPPTSLGSNVIRSGELDMDSSLELSVLQPPPTGSGKPVYIKRGPGRPRKDADGNSQSKNTKYLFGHKVVKQKNASSIYPPLNRGVRGRKKLDGTIIATGTNGGSCNTMGELGLFNHESPPRMTDDAAESDTSSVASSLEKLHEDFSLLPEQWPGKVCALCNLGERSMMGQGEMLKLEISIGFDPHIVSKGLVVACKAEKDTSSGHSPKTNLQSRRLKGPGKMNGRRLTSQGSLESMNEPVDEIVGYVDEPDLNSIFDSSTGHFFVHASCGLWCDGTVLKPDGKLTNLEYETVRALSQRCFHCGNLGASLSCKVSACGVNLHFPCAATSGAFQAPASRQTICVNHLGMTLSIVGAAANCTVCNLSNEIASQVMCSSCGCHFHSACMMLNSDPNIRAGWLCPACKLCQACRQPGDESRLLACDTCDKTYHIFCLRPALSSIPKHSWKCKLCRVCTDCGARTPGSGPSSRWHANFSVCDSCYQQRNKGLACPLCGKAYRHVAQKLMLQCHLCKKYVHGTCDPAADLTCYQQRKELYPDYEYICIPCKAAGTGLNTSGGNPRVLSALKEDLSSESGSVLNSFNAGHDYLYLPEDDSLLGTESSNDLSFTDKSHSITIEEVRPAAPLPKGKPISFDKLPKKKLGVGRPKNSEARKQRVNEFARKRGPKPKIRGVYSTSNRPTDTAQKGEEEPGVENRLVLCSARDEFVLQQDVCVMCGAFGNDMEGRLISCSQCGQCYHPYCVNVKVTKVVLQQGWRCLDCTVCEGCGQRNDEARLILCDDCDVSFHIYCMDPPLDFVPQGNWKCKWCAICQYCGSNDPGTNSGWHNNHSVCGRCASIGICPVCAGEYSEGELIIQCNNCDRWIHATCDTIHDEDEAEKCSQGDYCCVLCRPTDVLPLHLQPAPPSPSLIAKLEPPKSPESLKSRTSLILTVDGTYLSESGMQNIRSLTLDLPRKKRKKLSSNVADIQAGILATIESVVSAGDLGNHNNESEQFSKKRQRNLQKLGIGGFVARMRGPRFKDDDFERDFIAESDTPKKKVPRRKSKNKLVESFPPYLREAFFGKELMEPVHSSDGDIEAEVMEVDKVNHLSSENVVKLTKEEMKVMEQIKEKQGKATKIDLENGVGRLHQTDYKRELHKSPNLIKMENDDSQEALQDILTGDLLDNDLVDTIMNETDDIKVGDGLEDLAGTGLGDDEELGIGGNGSDGSHKDELTDFLSSQFTLEGMETGLPNMDGKDVEDLFKGVLTDESQESQDHIFSMTSTTGGIVPQNSGISNSGVTVMSSSVSTSSSTSTTPITSIPSALSITSAVQGSPSLPRGSQLQQPCLASPMSFPPPSPYHSEYSNSPQFSPAFSEPPSPWPTQSEAEVDQPSSYNQRSILKWEADEALGHNATISAVLFANKEHTDLKREFPNWAERSKQIAKIWRGLPPEKRAPYLQKARENRAASRMQKAQQITPDKSTPPASTASKKHTLLNQSPECEHGNNSSSSSSSSSSVSIPTKSNISEISPPIGLTDVFASVSTGIVSTSGMPLNHNQCTYRGAHAQLLIGPSSAALRIIPQQAQPLKTCPASSSGSREPLPLTASTVTAIPSSKCTIMESGIRVLTPSEIMRTLPTIGPEPCNFLTTLDQDKLLGPSKCTRTETPEERQWKQMQALRLQQAQQQGSEHRLSEPGKEAESSKYATNVIPVQRQLSSDQVNMDVSRQPLQITTSIQESHISMPQSSPHLQSPNSRQVFPGTITQSRMRPPTLEMPPPSPGGHYSPRGSIPPQGSPTIRQPMYPRLPYMHSPRSQLSGTSDTYRTLPADPYAQPPLTPRPVIEGADSFISTPNFNEHQKSLSSDTFMQVGGSGNSDASEIPPGARNIGTGGPQPPTQHGQETKQHLRDLLQRQQIKKLEQEQVASAQDPGPNTPRVGQWAAQDDWQKPGTSDSLQQSYAQRLPMIPNVSTAQATFRQPFLPSQVRMSTPIMSTQQQPISSHRPTSADFRASTPLNSQMSAQNMDARVRLLLQHQQRMGSQPSQPPTVLSRVAPFQIPAGHPPNLMGTNQFRLDSNIMTQTSGPNSVPVSTPSMLAQQLGRPLGIISNQGTVTSQTSLMSSASVAPNVVTAGVPATHPQINPSDHQELPDSVTAELEKLEQEQHNDTGVDGELVDLGVDDDELLGMGADFNILEYADPELDSNVRGEKTNILDSLDLEEDKEEEKDSLKRTELEKQTKKENPGMMGFSHDVNTAARVPKIGEPPPTSKPMIPNNPFLQQQQNPDVSAPILRPPQPPPPPYPGPPPPPYPGRPTPQMGIRNGCGGMGAHLTSLVGIRNPQIGLGMGGGGLRPMSQVLSGVTTAPCNPLAHPRRPLLLQEQPLLLEDLLEQEKREQQRQGPLVGAGPDEPLLSDFDFERLKQDVFSPSTLPVSLSPPNSSGLVVQPSTAQPVFRGLGSMGPQSQQPPQSQSQWPVEGDMSTRNVSTTPQQETSSCSSGNIPLHPALAQSVTYGPSVNNSNGSMNFPLPSIPTPPTPPENPTTEAERQMQVQYEQWLYHQQQVAALQLKFYETEVSKLRKSKKSLNSRQRQLRKNGGELSDNDNVELERIVRELAGLQKQLDLSRKQSKQHNMLIQDYRTKQQKRQQIMSINNAVSPVATQVSMQGPQPSPLGPASQSPLHSTPQSPLMSPSPSMSGPSPSPMMQNSPGPLPSPGPGPNSMAQASPRSVMNSMHHMDERPFSPGSDNSMLRPMPSPQGVPNQNRFPPQQQIPRMGSPGSQVQTPMNMNPNAGMMVPRNMNVNMRPMPRPMTFMDNQGHVRSVVPGDQMNRIPIGARFQRVGMNQDMMLRPRTNHPAFTTQNTQQMVASPGGQHYANTSRVVFPSQSPTGSSMSMGMVSLRSPSPMNPMGGLGSPPGSQTRVSPASSPMRRPSGGGSVNMDVQSPMPDRPQSVENPMTPRSTGSGPHTPSSIGAQMPMCQSMDYMGGGPLSNTPMHQNPSGDPSQYMLSECGDEVMHSPHSVHNYPQNYQGQNSSMNPGSAASDYNHSPGSSGGNGGGGKNIQILPFPTFSWFDKPGAFGLKGGSPFSIVNESQPSHSNTNSLTDNINTNVTQVDVPTGTSNAITVAVETNEIIPNSSSTSVTNLNPEQAPSCSNITITGTFDVQTKSSAESTSSNTKDLVRSSESDHKSHQIVEDHKSEHSTMSTALQTSVLTNSHPEGQEVFAKDATENDSAPIVPKSNAKHDISDDRSIYSSPSNKQPVDDPIFIDNKPVQNHISEPKIQDPEKALKVRITNEFVNQKADASAVTVLATSRNVGSSVPVMTTVYRPDMKPPGVTNVTTILVASPSVATKGSVSVRSTGSDQISAVTPSFISVNTTPSNLRISNCPPLYTNTAVNASSNVLNIRPTTVLSQSNVPTVVQDQITGDNSAHYSAVKETSEVKSIIETYSINAPSTSICSSTGHTESVILSDALQKKHNIPGSIFVLPNAPSTVASLINNLASVSPSMTSTMMHNILAQKVHNPLQQKMGVNTGPLLSANGTAMTIAMSQVAPSFVTASAGLMVTGESQNALLKQLLQNTGCASMTQASAEQATGFSLTSCLQARPVNNVPVHTSHLSEAATRIPQPTPIVRPPQPAIPTMVPPIRMPFIPTEIPDEKPFLEIDMLPLPPVQPPSPGIIDVKPTIPAEDTTTTPPLQIFPAGSTTPPTSTTLATLPPSSPIVTTPKLSFRASFKETIDVVANENTVLDSTYFNNRRSDDDAKKQKRRQYQQKRRQSNTKELSTPKKRMRKGSKLEEDLDVYMDNMLSQLRQLPTVAIVEPELGRNFSICTSYASGEFCKLNCKGYSTVIGDLDGNFARALVDPSTETLGPGLKSPVSDLSQSTVKQSSTQRGFYNQEFASPRQSSNHDKAGSESCSPTLFREIDTPDTILTTSSPESFIDENELYSGLRLIEEDIMDFKRKRNSPIFPLIYPVPLRPLTVEQLRKHQIDMDKENRGSLDQVIFRSRFMSGGGMSPLRECDSNVCVTLTLTAEVAHDILGILRNLANALSISSPSIFQIVDRDSPPVGNKLDLQLFKDYHKHNVEDGDIQSVITKTLIFCKHCDILVSNDAIKKKFPVTAEVTQDQGETKDEAFCSTTCFMQYSLSHGASQSPEEKAATIVNHFNLKIKVESEEASSGLKDCPFHNSSQVKDKKLENILGKRNKNICDAATSVENQSELLAEEPITKKWKGIRYKKWTPNFQPQQKYKKPSEKEMTEMLFRLGITVTPPQMPEDTRRCMFCHQLGDGLSDGPGRLLNYDVDKWVHLNCALWSEEVYETENGALVNVEVALKQSLTLVCVTCKQNGATVKCFKIRCSSVYHLGCAVKDSCVFYKNKTMYCPAHSLKGEKENELSTLSVFRRVYIQRDENRQVAAVMHHADQYHLLRVGSLIFLSVGQLLPHQLPNFHTNNCIYPVGYKIMRFYWSMKIVNRRCQYMCSIHEVDGKPEFRISPEEEGNKDCVIKSETAQGAWFQVLESIAKLRSNAKTIRLFPKYITGEDLFGLTEPAIVKVLESLPGIETLTDYHFKYGRNPLLELPLAINPTGCARAEPKLRTHFKRPHTQRTCSSSRGTFTPTAVIAATTEATCPYSKQFVHSKSSQYKKMKQEWRNNVFLARSKIQGLGLYAARDIEKHTMVIEYIGETIRSELAELREKQYEARNRGIYMFRVDEDRVIDATLSGGLARYINHSCHPNCVAETVEVDRDLRIIIFTNRRISRGEELAYDYKFEFEDDQHKIPCTCGAPNCRQWMN